MKYIFEKNFWMNIEHINFHYLTKLKLQFSFVL